MGPGLEPSFTGGATLQVPIRGRFDLVTGLRYVQQGDQKKIKVPLSPPLSAEARIYQDYLSVPALLTYYPAQRFFFSVGPEIGLLIAAHDVVEYSDPPLPDQAFNDKNALESTNTMVDAAAGYELPVANHVGTITLRYTRGLTGVAKNGEWATDWDTRGVELLLGMRW